MCTTLGAAFAVAAVLLCVSGAAAQSVPTRRVGAHWVADAPHVTFSARDLANNTNARRKLMSGLPQTVALQIFVYAEKSASRPVAVETRSCRVVYDLWEERFRVQFQTSTEDKAIRLKSVDEVLEACLVLRAAPMGHGLDYGRVRGEAVYLAVLAELNPLSNDTVQRIRRWLARPSGDRLEGEAFFGSFVSLFVSQRIGKAEKVLRFRSQALPVP